MSFKQLIAKVAQAERVLETRERRVADDVARLKASWRQAWTPGRIVIAGLAAGFLAGRARPLRAVGGSGQWLQLVTMLSGLLASGGAKAAAEEAERAADAAGQVAGVEVRDAATRTAPPAATASAAPEARATTVADAELP